MSSLAKRDWPTESPTCCKLSRFPAWETGFFHWVLIVCKTRVPPYSGARSAASNPAALCAPSQKGRFLEAPQRQSATAGLSGETGNSLPSASVMVMLPSTTKGPLSRIRIFAGSDTMKLHFGLGCCIAVNFLNQPSVRISYPENQRERTLQMLSTRLPSLLRAFGASGVSGRFCIQIGWHIGVFCDFL